VFLIGVEEGVLPHQRSIDDERQLEEERRLFYVGIPGRCAVCISSARSAERRTARRQPTPRRGS